MLGLGAPVLSRHGKAAPLLPRLSKQWKPPVLLCPPAHLPPQQELLLGAVNSELFLLSLRKGERLFLYRQTSPV